MTGRSRSLLIVAASLAVLGTPLTAGAQLPGADLCSPVLFCPNVLGMYNNCGTLVTYAIPSPGTIFMVSLSMATYAPLNVVSCNTTPSPGPMYRRFTARASTGAPLPRRCAWIISWNPPGPALTTIDHCLIDSIGDNLPVELMDFSVE